MIRGRTSFSHFLRGELKVEAQHDAEHFGWSAVVEALSGTIIQRRRDSCNTLMARRANIASLGQVLADQSIRILIRAALPARIRIGKISLETQPPRQLGVLDELAAVVGGHRLAEVPGQLLETSNRTGVERRGTTARGDGLNSNDMLIAVRYPDKSTGLASSGEQELFTTNALGQTLTKTDRNGNVHTFGYDIVGRITSEAVANGRLNYEISFVCGRTIAGQTRRLCGGWDWGDISWRRVGGKWNNYFWLDKPIVF